MKIKGKTALVLGGGKGIGQDIGFFLASQGATVVLTYFDWPEESAKMCQKLKDFGGKHKALKVDLRSTEQVENLLDKISIDCGELHILINNIERGGMPVVHGE